jgi:hypothetical protein
VRLHQVLGYRTPREMFEAARFLPLSISPTRRRSAAWSRISYCKGASWPAARWS